MRKTTYLLALTALVAVLGAFAAVCSAAPSSTAPHVKVLTTHPVTVQGTGFRPHAHLKVTFMASQQVSKRVTAGRHGRFTVTFKTTFADRCTQWTVKISQPGHAPVVWHGPRPMCAPAGGY